MAVTITPVGSVADEVYSSGGTSLGVSPHAAGNALVLVIDSHAGFACTGVSGGGATWTRAVQYVSARGHDMEMWLGQVTAAGSSPVAVTWPAGYSGGGYWTEYTVQEFSSSLGATSSWSVVIGQAKAVDGPSSTTLPYPSLTPSAGTVALYYGYAGIPNSPSAGSTPGVTYGETTGQNEWCYDTAVTATISPTATQSPAGLSDILGALFTPVAPTVNASGSLAGSGELSATSIVEIPATGEVAGDGSLSVEGGLEVPGSAELKGAGQLSTMGTVEIPAQGDLVAATELAASGTVDEPTSAELVTTGALTAEGTVEVPASGEMVGEGRMAAAGAVVVPADAQFTATGGLQATGSSPPAGGTVDLEGSGSLAADATVEIPAPARFEATGQLDAEGTVSIPAGATLEGSGSLIVAQANGIVETVATLTLAIPTTSTLAAAVPTTCALAVAIT